MEVAGLTALPVEVIHHISLYLSVQDVLSCSLTCYYLRAALNDNCVWRKYLPQDISGLETQEQQVSPRLEMGESLTPLCEMRQQFTRKSHLMKNWRTGKFVQYTSSYENVVYDGRGVTRRFVQVNSIYKDKYIFLSCRESLFHDKYLGIEIWDISKDPIFYTFLKTDNFSYYNFTIIGSHLIITEGHRVCVYRINLPDKDVPLLYSFFVTENDATLERIVTDGYVSSWWNYSFVRNCLMSVVGGRLHIWDIDNASKIGSFELPECACDISVCSFIGNVCMFWLMSENSRLPDCLVTFNLDNNQFSDKRVSFKRFNYEISIISYNYYVTLIKTSLNPNCDGLHDVICALYDFNTSLKLEQKSFISKTSIPVLSHVVNGTYIITCHDSLHVINALTLDIVNTLNLCSNSLIRGYFNIHQHLIAVEDNYMLGRRMELWDVNNKVTLLKDLNIKGYSDLYLDSICTKLVIIEDRKISVVHLW